MNKPKKSDYGYIGNMPPDREGEAAYENAYAEWDLQNRTEICPDCSGDGIVVDIDCRPVCCGFVDNYGGCCNIPIPERSETAKQCDRCQASGRVIS